MHDSEQENPFNTKPYEFIVNMFTQPLSDVINHLFKLGLIHQPTKLQPTNIPLRLSNHNAFMMYTRREYRIDMLKKEKEMNAVYDSISEEEDQSEQMEYTIPLSNDVATIKPQTKVVSLCTIRSSSSSDDELTIYSTSD